MGGKCREEEFFRCYKKEGDSGQKGYPQTSSTFCSASPGLNLHPGRLRGALYLATIAVTLDTYPHALPGLQEAARAFNKNLGQMANPDTAGQQLSGVG